MLKRIKKREGGFTLIELLLISFIVLLTGASVVVLFTGGGKTWSSADKGSETIQNAVIGMEKVVREIKNSPGLTYISSDTIRFEVLRKDVGDLDGDGNTAEYIVKYAMTKRDGDYLKYGERDADSDSEVDWVLDNLAYPVTNLSFSFLDKDGNLLSPSPSTDPADVKSVVINMTTSENNVTIPLKSRTYLVMEGAGAFNFDGTPDDPGIPGFDPNHFNEPNVESSGGSNSDSVSGWGLPDYVIYGDKEVSIRNNSTIYGNVGSRLLSGAPYVAETSVEINGYLIVKGAFKMENSGAITGEIDGDGNVIFPGSVLAACNPASPASVSFANNCQVNGDFWTLNPITMANSSWINGLVHQPEEDVSCSGTSKYNGFYQPPIALRGGLPIGNIFMLDPAQYPGEVSYGQSVFPYLPPGETDGFDFGTGTINYKKASEILGVGSYGNVNIDNGSNITLTANSAIRNLSITNSSIVNIPQGDYYFGSIEVNNSCKIRFTGPGLTRIFINGQVPKKPSGFKNWSFELSNSSAFEFTGGIDPSMLYVEAQKGFCCSNSVQWKGFIYAPYGNIYFANGTTLVGAAYAGISSDPTYPSGKVEVSDHVTATYKAPIATLLPAKFYSYPPI